MPSLKELPEHINATAGSGIAHHRAAASLQESLCPSPDVPPEILLVEDNDINLKILCVFMKKLGRSYHTARNGAEAVESYMRDPSRCKYVFMDISMPIMDGFEATRRIRNYERENHVEPSVIFALSAQQKAHVEGADLYLTKPLRLKELELILKSRGLSSAE